MKRAIFTLLVLLPFVAMAQEKEKKNELDTTQIYNLNEVVVSATKTSRPVLEIPMRVQAVPAYVIKSGSYFSVDDILMPISGVSVSRGMSFLDRKSTVSMRGMGSDQGRTLILLNGMPINKASTGSVNFNMLNLSNVDRVEVVKGPGSSIYGGNSMGGTINFITREPERKFEGNVSADYGTFNTVGTSVNLASRLNKVYVGVNAFARNSTGYNAVPEEERTAQSMNSYLQEAGVGAVIGYYINPTNKLEFTTTYYDGNRTRGERLFVMNGNQVSDVVDATVEQNSGTFNLSYTGTSGNFAWTANAFLSTEDYNEVKFKGTDIYDVKGDRRDWGVWFNQNFSGFKNQTITVGLEYKGGFVDGRDDYRTSSDVIINKGESNAFAVYLQDEIRPGNGRLSIIPALRFDYARFGNGGFSIDSATSVSNYLVVHGATGELPNENWTSVNPRLAMQYRIGQMSRVYVNIGTGFRPGSLEDMCRTGPISGGVVVANPNLKPEHLVNYEAGADFSFVKGLVISPSVYYSVGRDFIYAVNTGDSILMGSRKRPILKQSNVGKVEIKGFEIDVNYSMNNYLSVFANYTNTSSKIKEYSDSNNPDKNLDGKYLTYVPKFQASVGGTWRSRWINANVLYRQIGKQYTTDENIENTETEKNNTIPEYGLFDAKIWWLFPNRVTLTFGANNLFDKQVNDSHGNLTMGRYLYTKVSFSF